MCVYKSIAAAVSNSRYYYFHDFLFFSLCFVFLFNLIQALKFFHFYLTDDLNFKLNSKKKRKQMSYVDEDSYVIDEELNNHNNHDSSGGGNESPSQRK